MDRREGLDACTGECHMAQRKLRGMPRDVPRGHAKWTPTDQRGGAVSLFNLGTKVRYTHSAYSTREGVIIEANENRVKVQWGLETFQNPTRTYQIKIKTWVSKSRIELLP